MCTIVIIQFEMTATEQNDWSKWKWDNISLQNGRNPIHIVYALAGDKLLLMGGRQYLYFLFQISIHIFILIVYGFLFR